MKHVRKSSHKPVQLTLEQSRPSPIEEAYQHFRLDRQAMPVSRKTLVLYQQTIGVFLRWLRVELPEVRRFEDLDVNVVRAYRARGRAAGTAWQTDST